MSVVVGDRLPEAGFMLMTEDGPAKKTVSDLFSGKVVALFAVPGAFTPTCHKKHLPGFVEHAEALGGKGIDEIYCTAVNDVHVLTHWAAAAGAPRAITMLADGNAEFAKAVGLDIDRSASGMGIRSKRYAMIVDDGVVKLLNVEEDTTTFGSSSAENMLTCEF